MASFWSFLMMKGALLHNRIFYDIYYKVNKPWKKAVVEFEDAFKHTKMWRKTCSNLETGCFKSETG